MMLTTCNNPYNSNSSHLHIEDVTDDPQVKQVTHSKAIQFIVHAFEKACGHAINYAIKPRRPGDIAMCYCDPAKAKKELGWEAQYGIEDMCADSWRWQSQNPNGYAD